MTYRPMSQSYEVACWIVEQPKGTRLTSKAVHQRLPHISLGAISGCMHKLSQDESILKLLGKAQHNKYIYEVRGNSLVGFNFNKRHAAYERKRKVIDTPQRRLPNQGTQVKTTLNEFMNDPHLRKQFLRHLDEEELWAELQRRDRFK